MANAIELFKQYIAMLDEIYKLEAKTNVLDGANELVRQGANANELVIPMIDMDGLANYSRSSGYVNGSVDFKFETVKCTVVVCSALMQWMISKLWVWFSVNSPASLSEQKLFLNLMHSESQSMRL